MRFKVVRFHVVRFTALTCAAVFGFAAAMAALPHSAMADPFLKREPLLLPPYISVMVDTGTCGAGMVMKVRGAIPGRSRQRTCVPMGSIQARNGNVL